MSLKQRIIDYRNTHKESRIILGVLLGEFQKIEKDPKHKSSEITDDECINIIKKLIQSNIECNELEENKILEQFIPSQLDSSEISEIILEGQFKSIKECMNFFKEQYNGRYNGKEVSEIYKKLF